MATKNGPNMGILTFGLPGEAHYLPLMAQWRALDFWLGPRVTSMVVTAPPGSPTDGLAYVVPAGATGAWAGKTGQVARWTVDLTTPAWEFYVPKSGWVLYNIADGSEYSYNGTAWVPVGSGSSVNVLFRGNRPLAQALITATLTKVLFNAEDFDTANCFDATTGIFTPNVAGYYQINWRVSLDANGSTMQSAFSVLTLNGTTDIARGTQMQLPGLLFFGSSGSDIVLMNGTTDNLQVRVQATNASGNPQVFAGAIQNYFSGAFLHA